MTNKGHDKLEVGTIFGKIEVRLSDFVENSNNLNKGYDFNKRSKADKKDFGITVTDMGV